MTLENLDETRLNNTPTPTEGDAPAVDPISGVPSTEVKPGGEVAVQPAGTQANGEGQQPPSDLKPRQQEYWNKLNRDKHAALRRAEASEAANRALTEQLTKARNTRQASNDPAEIIRHVATDAVTEGRATAHAQTRDDAMAEAATLEKQAWQATAADAQARYPDFNAVVNNENLAISPEMARTIRELPVGADIAYYLGKNPDKADEIYALPARSQAAALTRLITHLPAQKAQVQSRTSGAPAPVAVISGKSGNQERPLAELPMDQYIAARAKGRVS